MSTTAARSRPTGRRRGARGRRRRGLIWQGSSGSATIGISGTALFTLVDVTAQSAYFDSTVVRIRGDYSVHAAISSEDPANRLFIGVIVVSEEAAVAGATSIPNPQIDTAADWLYWRGHPFNGLATNGLADSFSFYVLDNRSMRKLMGANKHLVMVVRNSSSSAVTVDFAFALRTLVMLHG